MVGVSRLRSTVAAAIASLICAVVAAPASASPSSDDPVGRAVYRGAVIDLKDGWKGAQACVVFAAKDTRCFATHAEADALLGYEPREDPLVRSATRTGQAVGMTAVSAPACASGWLCLYEDANGGGRRLQFSDEYWHYLSEWGFDRKTSSWRNNQGASDNGHLSLYNSSTVYTCSARSYALKMGAYNDQAYAVWG